MKDILIGLLVIGLLLLIVGAANSGQRVDLDYVFGTWYQVSLFTLIAIAVGALVVVGLAAAAIAGIRGAGQRRKLERELEQTYVRLREAEAHAAEMTEKAAAASAAVSAAERRLELSAGASVGATSSAAVTDAAAGPDEYAAGPDTARPDAAGPDDRTIALRDQSGRDDV